MDDLDRVHAGHILYGARVDARHLGVRMWAADHFAVEHSGALEVVGVFRLAGNFLGTVQPRDTLSYERSLRSFGPIIFSHFSALLSWCWRPPAQPGERPRMCRNGKGCPRDL